MQLHEASAQYLSHREQLDNYISGECYDDCVWGVEYDIFHQAYYLLIHWGLGERLPPDCDFHEEYAAARHITKQRGGTRYFKTLDAVASALQQIGQSKMPLDRLPKPQGL